MAAQTRIPPPPVHSEDRTIWTNWYVSVKDAINNLRADLKWINLDFTGSNLTDVVTKSHQVLDNLQGGSSTERYHLTSAVATAVASFDATNWTDLTDSGASTLHYHASDRDRANHTGAANFTAPVGIGTTTPGATLGVKNSANGDIGLIVEGTTGQTADLLQLFKGSDNRALVDSGGSFRTKGRYQLVETDGSTIIQALYQEGDLVYLRAGSTANKILIKASNISSIAAFDGATHGVSIGSSYDASFVTDGLVVQGNVGIGTTAPDKKLEINLGTSDALRLTYNDASGSAAVYADLTISSTGVMTITPVGSAPAIAFAAPARLKGYTVATLPTGTQGDKAFVTDALAPTYLVAVVGGGAIVTEVFYNGAAWVCT